MRAPAALACLALAAAACRDDRPCGPRPAPAAPHPPGRELVYGILDDWDAEAARSILDDRWPATRFEPTLVPMPIDWAADPRKEKYWRFQFHSLRPAAHLLGAYLGTGDVRYRDKLLAVLADFATRAPCRDDGSRAADYLFDPHTAAFRAMMLVRFYFALGDRGELRAPLADRLRPCIAALGDFLATWSAYQGSSNHAVTQAIALYLIGVEFPDWPESAGWRGLALERIDRVLVETIDDDGAQIENSPAYHFYVLAFLDELATWARRHGVAMPPHLTHRLDHMVRFATALVHPDGSLPALGASRPVHVRTYAELGVIAGSPAFQWILSAGTAGAPPPRLQHFPIAGVAALRSPLGTAAALATSAHVLLDAGPYRTNHSDLDALHVTLFGAGRPLLIDAGLYSLERGPWRDYFHGSRGHNTVVVDGLDQLEGAAHLLGTAERRDVLAAAGEHALNPGVHHRRQVALIGADLLLVVDELDSLAARSFAQRWHLAPDLIATAAGRGAVARDAAGAPVLRVAQAADGERPEIVRGARNPIDGWAATAYEKAEPATVLAFRAHGTHARFVTAIAWGARAARPLAVRIDGTTVTVDGVAIATDTLPGAALAR